MDVMPAPRRSGGSQNTGWLFVRTGPAATVCDITTCVSLQELSVSLDSMSYNALPPGVRLGRFSPRPRKALQNLPLIGPNPTAISARHTASPARARNKNLVAPALVIWYKSDRHGCKLGLREGSHSPGRVAEHARFTIASQDGFGGPRSMVICGYRAREQTMAHFHCMADSLYSCLPLLR